jgi:hypothetical protein
MSLDWLCRTATPVQRTPPVCCRVLKEFVYKSEKCLPGRRILLPAWLALILTQNETVERFTGPPQVELDPEKTQ